MNHSSDITGLLLDWSGGNSEALEKLTPLVCGCDPPAQIRPQKSENNRKSPVKNQHETPLPPKYNHAAP